jgi:hypothetical protein
MPLITSTTNLNKLKFGVGNAGDRFDNGSSNQPYIRTDIPGVNMDNPNPTPITELDSSGAPIYGNTTPGSLDILFRGGLNAIPDSITDVSRLTKMFFDTKSPNGLIFIGNQNLLSRTSVMTEASYGIGYGRNKEPDFIEGTGGGALPGGIYLPSSTLAQAAVNFTGTHLNLMGLDPTSPNGITGQTSGISSLFGGTGPGGGLRTYSMVMNDKIQADAEDGAELSNRLVQIYDNKQKLGSSTDPDVIVYNGGPGSILGIGKTRIRFAGSNGTGTTRTGLNNALAVSNPTYFNGTDPTYSQKFQYTTLPDNETLAYGGEFGDDLTGKLGLSNLMPIGTNPLDIYDLNMLSATYTLGSSFPSVSGSEGDGSDARGVYTNVGLGRINSPYTVVYNASQLNAAQLDIPTPGNAPIGPDFRKLLIDTTGDAGEPVITSNILSLSPNYQTKNLNSRTNFGDPGANGPKTKNGGNTHRLNYGIKAAEMIAVDKINAQIMYSGSVAQDTTIAKNDLVKFRIAAIDNNDPSQALYMHFRAFIDSFSDAYTADWQGFKYSGRGENLYHYNGFDRQISLGFTVYAQSKAELIPMYKKLNYLASTLAPDYTAAGFMRGNIVRLTLGGYLYEQPGFISGITFEAPQESSWEIAINEEGNSDSSVKELPFMIKVSGMSFTPIHEFLPRKISTDSANGMTPDGVMIDERYIALDNGFNENYTNAQGEYFAQKSTNTNTGNALADVNIENA